MPSGSHHRRSANAISRAALEDLEDLPVGVALSRGGRRIVWANRAWRRLFGNARVAPVAYATPGAHTFDHEVDGELWTLRAAAVRLFGGPSHGLVALVAEDVTEAIFAGQDPSNELRPASFRLEPFVPPHRLAGQPSMIEQVIEPLWAPMLVLCGDPVRVAHANGAARSQYGFALGEPVEYATPLGLGGSLVSHFECMVRRCRENVPMPVRLWPSAPGGSTSLVMLEPSPVGSELYEPVLEGHVDDRSALE